MRIGMERSFQVLLVHGQLTRPEQLTRSTFDRTPNGRMAGASAPMNSFKDSSELWIHTQQQDQPLCLPSSEVHAI